MSLKSLLRYSFMFVVGFTLVFNFCQIPDVLSYSAVGRPFVAIDPALIPQRASGDFILPPLPYEYDALEPYISRETMILHHDKHHAGYVDKLNQALSIYPHLQAKTLEDLLTDIGRLPPDLVSSIIDNGGGHLNHSLFWDSMSWEGDRNPTGQLAAAIEDTFGDFETFQARFNKMGQSLFGSGWVWLIVNHQGNLEIVTTSNQDNPLLDGKVPLLGNDLWEHAYYLTYQNQRSAYLDAWWNVVDWSKIATRYQTAIGKREPIQG